MVKKAAKKGAAKKPARASRAKKAAAPAVEETPIRKKTSPLPTKDHVRICVTDANRTADSVVDIHASAFDGPKVNYNGKWWNHKDDVVVDGKTLKRYVAD